MKVVLAVLAALLLTATAASAQERLPSIPSLPPVVVVTIDGKKKPIEVRRVATEVRILGSIAETKTTMTFYNPHGRAHEGDLYFPLPEGATVSGYALDIGGSMVDGVAVTREKARRTFEKEVRKGIDPGIVEWTKGNVFRTRIFPLPARGTRTISVSYASDLIDTKGGAVYRLPLNFEEKVGEFSLRVEVVKSAVPPKVAESDLANFTFDRWNEGFLARTEMKDAALTKDLVLSLPPVEDMPVLVERDAKGVVRFVLTERLQPPAATRRPAPGRIAVLWDASGSRKRAHAERERGFLWNYLLSELNSRAEIAVDLIVFRDRAEAPRGFTVTKDNVKALVKALSEIDYDGGTQASAIALPEGLPRPDLVMLFTDGISTFGDSEPGKIEAPVYVINSSSAADASFMKSIARRTGGRYVNLLRLEDYAAINMVGQPVYSFLSTVADGAAVVETYPSRPEPANGRFLLAGVLRADEATVTLNFGFGEVAHSKTFTVKAADAARGDLLRRYWAQRKLGDLLVSQKENEHEITRLGRRHGLVTPFTSLIVLETLEQYVEHEILPPATLKEMREQYIEIVESRRKAFEVEANGKLDRIVKLWQERVKWWETKFEYPEDFRYRGGKDKSDGATGDPAPGSAAPRPTPDAPPEERNPRFGEGEDETAEGAAEKKAQGGNPGGGPAIALKGWDPKTPYIAALKAAPPAKRFAVYMTAREEYGTSPAFFLDCADYFLRNGQEALGIQVLSNIAEMELESAALLRILGHRLEQLGRLDLAVLVFEEAKKLRPEEPQSFRDLGLVLAKRGTRADLERAVELLYHVVLNTWDRFDEIELLALLELNQVLPKAKAIGIDIGGVDRRLVKPLDLDARIVMTWDADLTDMDLHVLEPSKEEAYYGHNRTTIGGLVSRDFTQGYGPEEYLLKKAMHGRYLIKANFYGSSAAKLIGAVTLHVDVYTNYGRPNQKVKSLTFRLTEKKEEFLIGEIEW